MSQVELVSTEELQRRFFELTRKRRFEDLTYVPNEREAQTLYVRDEGGKHYPRLCLLRCPDAADNAELREVEAALAARGVRMYL